MTTQRAPSRHGWVVAAALVAVASLAGVGAASTAAASRRAHPPRRTAPCTASTTTCALRVLAPAGGADGVYLRQVGGPVLASSNASRPFEPASSIKALIALYAITRVEAHALSLTTRVPMIDGSGGPDDCPPSARAGTEPLGVALGQMLEVSDNNRTRELMQYFGVSALNRFARAIGLRHTHFETSPRPPGFNVIGCDSYAQGTLPPTLDGNTLSLADAATVWTRLVTLPSPYAAVVAGLAAGRPMYERQGYDFSGIWPDVVALARSVAPARLTPRQVDAFLSHATVSVKGGSYFWSVCDSGPTCQRSWTSFAFALELPTCVGAALHHTTYVGGDFVAGSDTASLQTGAPAFRVIAPGVTRLVSDVVRGALDGWRSCAPASTPLLHVHAAKVTTTHDVGVTTTLATVTDRDPSDVAADLLATIGWGDGTAAGSATVDGGDGTFRVLGWHHYARAGTYRLSVSVRSEATGAVVSTTSTLVVP